MNLESWPGSAVGAASLTFQQLRSQLDSLHQKILLWKFQEEQRIAFAKDPIAPITIPELAAQASEIMNNIIHANFLERDRLLEELVRVSFIVTNQPPRVIKENIKIHPVLKVCLLIGNSKPLSSSTLSLALMNKNRQNAGEFETGDTANFSCDGKSSMVKASFENAKLKTVIRGEKKNSTKVMDELFYLNIDLTVDINSHKIKISTETHPVTVSTHSIHHSPGTATIVWRQATAMAEKIRPVLIHRPPGLPSSISMNLILDIMSGMFINSTGKELYPFNRTCLYNKAFLGCDKAVKDSGFITLAELNKKKLPGPAETFSVWEWFFQALKLVSEGELRKMWNLGYVLGFIESEEWHCMLNGFQKDEEENFLFRFSESTVGAITISHLKNRTFQNAYGMNRKQLNETPLATKIREIVYLKMLLKIKDTIIPPGSSMKDFIELMPKSEVCSNFPSNPKKISLVNHVNYHQLENPPQSTSFPSNVQEEPSSTSMDTTAAAMELEYSSNAAPVHTGFYGGGMASQWGFAGNKQPNFPAEVPNLDEGYNQFHGANNLTGNALVSSSVENILSNHATFYEPQYPTFQDLNTPTGFNQLIILPTNGFIEYPGIPPQVNGFDNSNNVTLPSFNMFYAGKGQQPQ